MNQKYSEQKNIQAQAVVSKDDIDRLREQLNLTGETFRNASPHNLDVERFKAVIMNLATKNTYCFTSDRRSFLRECAFAAQDGLMPDGIHATINPSISKNGNCNYMPMYKGLLKKLFKNENVRSVRSRIVHEKDKIEICYGDAEKIIHEPLLDGDPGKVKGVYTIIHLESSDSKGEKYKHLVREYMTAEEIEAVEKKSKAKRFDSPWVMWWGEMAKKTVLKRLLKTMDITSYENSEVINSLNKDNIQYSDNSLSIDEQKLSSEIDNIIEEKSEFFLKENNEVKTEPNDKKEKA